MSEKKRQVPHTYVIVFAFIVISAIATWFVPGGNYIDVPTPDGSSTTKIYQAAENHPQSWQIFSAIFNGFEKQAGIIIFILMIGGAFWLMNESKALDVAIHTFLRFTRKLERFSFIRKLGVDNIVITLIMLMFSIFGAVFGMSEETIAFVIIFVPLSISMGYDSIVGISMCFVAAALGFAGAILNPFTIGIAQGLAGLPLFSGIEYRMFSWLVINLFGIIYILRYASKVKKNPKLSPVYDDDQYWREKDEAGNEKLTYYTPLVAWITFGFIVCGMTIFSFLYPRTVLSVGNAKTELVLIPVLSVLFAIFGILSLKKSVHYFILLLLMYTIIYLIVGVMGYQWYIMEIASLFFAMGIFSGISMNRSANSIARSFIEGAKDIMSAALVVGLAGGIIIILQDGNIIGTILHNMSSGMESFGKTGTVSVMYGIQNLINIVIPSGSAKAALTMPIMAPFSDLIGLSRQATVLAFQFGDGFTNMITPTSGVLIGALGVARIPFNKWFKWVLPFILLLIFIGWLLLIPAATMSLNGF